MRDTLSTYAIIVLLAIGAGLLLYASSAEGHGWYTGKKDPQTGLSCCGGIDCDQIDADDVREVEGGYVFLPTREFIPHERVQQSHDFDFHRCVYLRTFERDGVTYEEGDTRCFFRPAGSV